MALLSIHPPFARAILSGDKRVELRKTRLRQGTTHVAVYATSPVKKVVGVFAVGEMDTATPDELWSRHGHVAGISRTDFNAYFAGRDLGVAIGVDGVTPLGTPADLAELDQHLRPPQNVVYLDQSTTGRLERLLEGPTLSAVALAAPTSLTEVLRRCLRASASLARAAIRSV